MIRVRPTEKIKTSLKNCTPEFGEPLTAPWILRNHPEACQGRPIPRCTDRLWPAAGLAVTGEGGRRRLARGLPLAARGRPARPRPKRGRLDRKVAPERGLRPLSAKPPVAPTACRAWPCHSSHFNGLRSCSRPSVQPASLRHLDQHSQARGGVEPCVDLGNRGRWPRLSIAPQSGRCCSVVRSMEGQDAALRRVGRVAENHGDLRRDERGKRVWRGVCATDPEAISARTLRHAGAGARTGV